MLAGGTSAGLAVSLEKPDGLSWPYAFCGLHAWRRAAPEVISQTKELDMYQVYDWNSAPMPGATMDFERAKAIAVTTVRNAPAGHESAYLLIIGENEWALRFGDLGEPVKLYGSEIPRPIRRVNKPE